MKGKNQSYARYLNNKLVMGELYKNACSATMLAQKLDLSNPAMSVIIDELKKNNLIVEDDRQVTVNVGRRPIYYKINGDYGRIVLVSLGDYVATVVVSDMAGEIIESEQTKVERYNLETIYELVLKVSKLIASPKHREVPLRGIQLSVPGLVNTVTGELQLSPQFDKDMFSEKNYIVNLFNRQFNVPVVMMNDINLAAIGERYIGLLNGVKCGLVVHVDEGVGGALILNGKLYTGSQGFAGEIGLMQVLFDGKEDALDEFVSLRALRFKLKEKYGEDLNFDGIVSLFESDEGVREYILSTARCLGKAIKNVVDILDISVVVISGGIARFGEKYIEAARDEAQKGVNGIKVVASQLGQSAVVNGGIISCIEAMTDIALEQLIN